MSIHLLVFDSLEDRVVQFFNYLVLKLNYLHQTLGFVWCLKEQETKMQNSILQFEKF